MASDKISEARELLRTALRLLGDEKPQEADTITVARPLYEAHIALANAVAHTPKSGEIRNAYPNVDYAYMRVWYEMARANGQDLPPFDDYLRTTTDFAQRHPGYLGPDTTLESAYREMAADTEREREASEWIEDGVGDGLDED